MRQCTNGDLFWNTSLVDESQHAANFRMMNYCPSDVCQFSGCKVEQLISHIAFWTLINGDTTSSATPFPTMFRNYVIPMAHSNPFCIRLIRDSLHVGTFVCTYRLSGNRCAVCPASALLWGFLKQMHVLAEFQIFLTWIRNKLDISSQ